MRRTVLLVLALLMMVWPIGVARADAPQVTIVTPGGAQHTLSLEALAGSEDVVEKVYPLRAEAGETSATVTGFTIAALLKAADVDPYGFSYLEVQRPGGGSVLLSSAQALGELAPVVYSTGTGTGFLRPAAGAEDFNGADSFQSPAGLTIVMRKGASLQARVEATPRKVKVGEKVDFRAVVERSGSGEALAYSWYFDDGGSAEGETATHSFAKPGSYSVVVEGRTRPRSGRRAARAVLLERPLNVDWHSRSGRPARGPEHVPGADALAVPGTDSARRTETAQGQAGKEEDRAEARKEAAGEREAGG
jgi:hypothetical protein